MKNEEAQPLLGNGSNTAAKDLPTDSKTRTTKKGYSGVRLSMVFGTFAFLLLGVVFFADRGGGKINTNIVANNIRSSFGNEILHYCDWLPDSDGDNHWVPTQCDKGGKCPNYPHIKSGMCETEGNSDDVLPYLDHQKIIPGKIYYGLDFTDGSSRGNTYTPHQQATRFFHVGNCVWGGGESVGRCIRHGDLPNAGDERCPSKQKQIVKAWKECAKICNDQPECHTFTVKTKALLGHRDFLCYFHNWYKCKHENNKAVGIDHYVKQGDVRDDDDLGVWSGICRTISGRTSDYACSKTPVETPIDYEDKCAGNYGSKTPCCGQGGGAVAPRYQCPESRPICKNYIYGKSYGHCQVTPADCQLCGDKKNYCCNSVEGDHGWNYHCDGCATSF